MNGPAYLGGVLPGDIVIAVNGARLAAYDTWLHSVNGLVPGQPLHVGLLRHGDAMEVTIIADRRPTMPGTQFDLARLDSIQARFSKRFDSIIRMFGAQPSDSVILGVASTGERLLQWEARVQVSWQQTATREVAGTQAARPRPVDASESVEARRTNLARAREEAELRTLAEQGMDPSVAGGGGELRAAVEGPDGASARTLTPFFLERPVVLGGAQVWTLTSELGRRFGVEAGVLVTDVLLRSAAARADFRPGDVIVAVAGDAVSSLVQLRAALAIADLPATITVVRHGNVVDLTYPARQADRRPIGSG